MVAGEAILNQDNRPLSQRFPGGCYIGFNAAIDRKAAEQLVMVCTQAVQNGYATLNLAISSPGGQLDHAYYAYNWLEGLPVKIVTHNIGSVQSAANLLFLCGDDRYGVDASTFFFHQTGFDTAPAQRISAKFVRERLKAMKYDDSRTAQIYAAKTGRPIKDVRKWMDTELVMDTIVAVQNGLIQHIRPYQVPPDAFHHQVVV
jgi:ATP-dependent protease ClpP protease subunit